MSIGIAGAGRLLAGADPFTARLLRVVRQAVAIVTWLCVIGSGPIMLAAAAHFNGNQAFFDFRGGLYNAGVAILHGRPFYAASFLAHQAAIMHAGGIARGELYTNPFSLPVYPALSNVAVVPLALLPFGSAAALFTLLSAAAMVTGVWLLGVRDPRCLIISLFSWPFLFGAFLGAVGPFLLLGAAVVWHWRERAWPCALALAAIVAAKIFPWPLGVWLLMRRRYRAAALSVVACLVITVAAWATIGFAGMAQYPQMLANMSFIQEGRAVSLVTVMLIAGIPSGVAHICAFVVAGLILLAAWRLSSGPDGDRRAFGLVVIAALTATPIVWEHYMVLLFIPIALAAPRLSGLWMLPLLSPLVESISRGIIPDSHRVQAYSPNALRGALLWLALEAIVALWLCTTREQRAALPRRLTGRRVDPVCTAAVSA
ncbi:MAG: glycosyltransferase family 87 protein [Solirubrobacteraceae bacterium]